jgi:hypothetical protein
VAVCERGAAFPVLFLVGSEPRTWGFAANSGFGAEVPAPGGVWTLVPALAGQREEAQARVDWESRARPRQPATLEEVVAGGGMNHAQSLGVDSDPPPPPPRGGQVAQGTGGGGGGAGAAG